MGKVIVKHGVHWQGTQGQAGSRENWKGRHTLTKVRWGILGLRLQPWQWSVRLMDGGVK